MRGILLSLVCVAGILAMTPMTSSAAVAPVQPVISSSTSSIVAVPTTMFALQTADKKVDININTSSGGGRWYRSPVWIAIFVIGGVLILFMLAMIVRGSS